MNIEATIQTLDSIKRKTKNGGEYWMGRDMQLVLGYEKWDKFEMVIKRASEACESAGVDVNDHFLQTGKLIVAGKGAQLEKRDYFLTRYACYLVAMNGDSSKPEIGTAQTYFAIQTRKQEQLEKLSSSEKRLLLRERVKDANKHLNSAAKNAGVQNYALFHDAGYRGLYGMGLTAIKERKRIERKESPLDRMGRAELAANEFRITQTEEALIRENIKGQKPAEQTHEKIGKKVRATIHELGGTMPENLSPEPSIKRLEASNKKRLPKPTDSN